MDIFKADEDIDLESRSQEQRRLDAEWLSISALREVLGIALKNSQPPTYDRTRGIAEQLLPVLFHRDRSLIARRLESHEINEYRERADARSEIENRQVPLLELLSYDIRELEGLLESEKNRPALRRKLNKLLEMRRGIEQISYVEGDLILRDMCVGEELPISRKGDGYRDILLPENRVMRIRLLHPNRPEHLTGADVIYEHYNLDKKLVHLTAIQYKIWNGTTLYKSRRLTDQLEKLQQAFCNNSYCKMVEADQHIDLYRLPCCTAFLRPTDELQLSDTRIVSSGFHIPICVVERKWQDTQRTGQKLVLKNIRNQALTFRIFEELFNTEMLGSRWLTYQEVEKLFQKYEILKVNDHLIIHSQEFTDGR